MLQIKPPVNPLIGLKEELEFVDLTDKEINDCIKKYKKTLNYNVYLLKKCIYDFFKVLGGKSNE